jgi:hypothetical protein
MDRVNQALALLQQNSSRGISFYESRQQLLQAGFTDSEIDDASDRFDHLQASEQPSQPIAAGNSGLGTDRASEPAPLIPDKDTPQARSGISRYMLTRGIGLILLISFAIVLAAGNFYSKHHNFLGFTVYFGALGLSVVTVVYFNLILNLRRATNKSERILAGVIGTIACVICFALLGYTSTFTLR